MGLDAGLDPVLDAVLDAVRDNVPELAVTQRIKCDCAPPAFAGSAPEQAPSVAYASHQPVFIASGTYQIGNSAGLFEFNLRGNSCGAKRHVANLRAKIANVLEVVFERGTTSQNEREKNKDCARHRANAVPVHNRIWIWKTALTPLALRRFLLGRFLGFLG